MVWSEDELISGLEAILPAERLLKGEAVRRAYDADAYGIERSVPSVVVLPTSQDEVVRIHQLCHRLGVPTTPRGAGTGLSGGAMPALGGVVISTKKMTRILEIDDKNRAARVESGAVNAKVSVAAKPFGLHFAPDPSSQSVSTIGGNIAENSGGPHTLKYGVTTQHVLGLTLVLPDGEVLELGGRHGPDPGLDLLSLVVGSEGLLGTVTEAWLKLTPNPERVCTALASFSSIRAATETVAAIVKSGVIPAALEMMDRNVLVAVSQAFVLDFPEETMAMLLVETDGESAKAGEELESVIDICNQLGAIKIEIAKDETDRLRLWTARKKGVGALGRLAPTVVTHDGVIPPSALPEMLESVYEIAERYEIGVANIFHAGDGNLHPIFYFDERIPGKVDAVIAAGEEVIDKCVALGGAVTGEHGVGVEKVDLLRRMYDDESLNVQASVAAVFHNSEIQNACKVIPTNKACVEHKVRWRGVAT